MADQKEAPEVVQLAGGDFGGEQEQTSAAVRSERYGRARKKAREIAAYIRGNVLPKNPHLERMLGQLSGCAEYLLFHYYFRLGKTRLVKVHTCKKFMLCPLCALLRGAKQLRAYYKKWSELHKQNPSWHTSHMVLTVKAGPDLEERLNHLKKSLRKLQNRRRVALGGGRGNTQFKSIRAGVFAIELSKSRKGWRPHYHAIIMHDGYLDIREISKEWLSATGDSKIVWIKEISKEEPVKAFCEVFKYALTFFGKESRTGYVMTNADFYHAHTVVHGKQNLISSIGDFRTVEVPCNLDEESIDDEPYIEYLFRFVHGQGYAQVQKTFHDKGHAPHLERNPYIVAAIEMEREGNECSGQANEARRDVLCSDKTAFDLKGLCKRTKRVDELSNNSAPGTCYRVGGNTDEHPS